MKKLFFTGLFGLAILFPDSLSAYSANVIFIKELSGKKPRKSKMNKKTSRKDKFMQDHTLPVKDVRIMVNNYM